MSEKHLTVIMRNDAPLMFSNDPPTHRSLVVPLTGFQLELLKPRVVGKSNGKDIHECIAMCFIEGGDDD